MKLVDQRIGDFIDVLASDAPAPGGGSAAALSSAMGIALTGMVAALTVDKPKYAEHDELTRRVLSEAESLRHGLTDAIDRDTEAFNGVSEVFSMPKSTDEEKAARKAAMQAALKSATAVPLEVMELSLKALELTAQAVGKSNANAASDLGVAALSLLAGVKSAWLNVLINLVGVADADFVERHKAKGQEILEKAESVSGDIYGKIVSSL
ncbi:MAG: cyclodeaminase/cyclohydrolase family protein [Defluviitaleaceae bacterium]|nr:cyclodeaminase/cyclohydrolase family protein [Defluviitaleaceae bacterium]